MKHLNILSGIFSIATVVLTEINYRLSHDFNAAVITLLSLVVVNTAVITVSKGN